LAEWAKIMIAGCNPKADFTRLVLGGLVAQKTVSDTLREEGGDIELEMVLKESYAGICLIVKYFHVKARYFSVHYIVIYTTTK
jgi:nitrogenase subunit NifH